MKIKKTVIASLSVLILAILAGGYYVYSMGYFQDENEEREIEKTGGSMSDMPEPKREMLGGESEEAENNSSKSGGLTAEEKNLINDVPERKQEDFSQKKEEVKKTNPATGPFSFSAIGDSEKWSAPEGFQERVLETWEKAAEMENDLVFFTGDVLVTNAETKQENRERVQSIKNQMDEILTETKYHVAFGSHDLECGEECFNLWQEVFFNVKNPQNKKNTAYLSFDYSNTHFVLLSNDYPEENSIDEKQLNWLDNDLQKTRQENVIVFAHIPPVNFFEESAEDCHDVSCNEEDSAAMMEIFKKHSVDLVISGHEEAFDHQIKEGIDFVLSGNADGGEPRYDGVVEGKNFAYFQVDGERITLKGIDVDDDSVIREIKIK
ncbi:MAG: metallophosphoesterase [Candidatus Moranbacteria bacterium]|nr:metallophosphoesterase [Candidatus Moranbacteria bacterium]